MWTTCACLGFVYSDTGSDVFLQKNSMKLKEILMDIKKDIQLNTDARRDLDKELSELTRRYRELVIENNDIKTELVQTKDELMETRNAMVKNITTIAKNVSSVKTDITDKLDKTNAVSHNRTKNLLSKLKTYLEKELEVTKNDIVSNMTSVSMDLTDELKDVVKAQEDSAHKASAQLSKLQGNLKRELEKTKTDMVYNITSVTADMTKKFDNKLKVHSSTHNRTDISLSKLRGAMSSLNQTLTSAIKIGTQQRGQQAKDISKLKQETENSDTNTNQTIAIINGTLMDVAKEVVRLQEKVDSNPVQYKGELIHITLHYPTFKANMNKCKLCKAAAINRVYARYMS